ncbi:MAG: rod shape-determining protein MreC [Patescibacteria group bacterium]
MSYQLNDDRKRRKERRRVQTILLAVLILFVFGGLFHRALSPAAIYLFSPVVRGFNALTNSLSPVFSIPFEKAALLKENVALRDALRQKDLELYQYEALEKDIELRKEALEVGTSTDLVLANVLMRPPRSPYDTFIIDHGEESGIREGDEAIYAKVVLGEVDQVYGNRSRIKLFSSSGREISIFIGEKKIEAVAVGKGGGNFEARLPRGVEIAKGDNVVFPNSHGGVFAVVEEIEAKASDTFQRVYFQNPVNISELRYIAIKKEVLHKEE